MCASKLYKVLLLALIVWGCEPETAAERPALVAELPDGTEMAFVWIDPGTFVMGSPPTEPGRDDDEAPQRELQITQGFYLARTEITQQQWAAVMDTQPWTDLDFVLQGPDYPAAGLSWLDVERFAAALNASAGARLYRLPTEAEWEYACRAGTTTRWSFGDDEALLDDFAWHTGNTWDVGLRHSQLVATKNPNPWGLYDMHGNLWEWVHDWYSPEYYGRAPKVDPPGPTTGIQRVLRGGYFHNNGARRLRSANRLSQMLHGRYASVGARLLREGPP